MKEEKREVLISKIESNANQLALPFLFLSLIITGFFLLALIPLPNFNTDLSDFAPTDNPSIDAEERFSEYFDSEARPMFVHVVPKETGANALSIEYLKQQDTDYQASLNFAIANGDFITNSMSTPGIIQLALDEQSNGTEISELSNWEELLNNTLDDDFVCGDVVENEQFLVTGSFAQSSLLNKDLDYSNTCSWLSNPNSTNDMIPTSSTTLWVYFVDPNLEPDLRKQYQSEMRTHFIQISDNSTLDYNVVSLDLINHDIDEGTFRNLALLILIALIVVVLILAIAFRSARDVIFPLVGLSCTLIWTYGALASLDSSFNALDVAVAPLVLGLGIDYSIHLQRRYNLNRESGMPASISWVRACERLSVPLTLAVLTTVAAFLSNIISPLPPLKEFGIALAVGVVCAFLTSTILVGSLHLVLERSKLPRFGVRNTIEMKKYAAFIVGVQRKHQAMVLVVTGMLTLLSIFAALSIQTEFDLSDFLDDEMEVMQVRNDLNSEYESSSWKVVYLLMEPVEGVDYIPDDIDLLRTLESLDSGLCQTTVVVRPIDTECRAAYDGIYPVLRDAVELDSSWGDTYNLDTRENFAGSLSLVIKNKSSTLDLSSALLNLSNNASVGDPLTGETWSDRINSTVAFNSNNDINYLRMEIYVNAITNSDSAKVVQAFEVMLGNGNGDYKIKDQLSNHALVYLSGDLVKLNLVIDGLTTSQLESTAISLLASFVVLGLLTRRVIPAIIVLVPVGISAFWVVGSMMIFGLNWNILTVMVTALTIGIGIDYSIHVWRRYESEVSNDSVSSWEAMEKMHSTTGVALLLSAGTTVCGFLVLIFSPMPVVRDFGIVTAITVFFSLILSLYLLPILLATSDSLTHSNDN